MDYAITEDSYKICRGCGDKKGTWNFKVDNRMPDGISNHCKSCARIDSEAGRRRRGIPLRVWKDADLSALKHKARQAAYSGIRTGKLDRPDICSECGVECQPEGHHEDYHKPLEVVWVCKDCHWNKHKGDKNE